MRESSSQERKKRNRNNDDERYSSKYSASCVNGGERVPPRTQEEGSIKRSRSRDRTRRDHTVKRESDSCSRSQSQRRHDFTSGSTRSRGCNLSCQSHGIPEKKENSSSKTSRGCSTRGEDKRNISGDPVDHRQSQSKSKDHSIQYQPHRHDSRSRCDNSSSHNDKRISSTKSRSHHIDGGGGGGSNSNNIRKSSSSHQHEYKEYHRRDGHHDGQHSRSSKRRSSGGGRGRERDSKRCAEPIPNNMK